MVGLHPLLYQAQKSRVDLMLPRIYVIIRLSTAAWIFFLDIHLLERSPDV